MARRAINISLNGQGIQSATFNDFSFLGTQKDASGVSVYSGANMPSYVTSLGDVVFNQGEAKTYTAENGSVYKRIIQGSYNITTATLQAEGFSNWDISIGQTSYVSQNWLGFVVDDDTQEGWIVVITLYRETTYLVNYYYSKTNNQDTYYFIGNEYVPYHWSSVPAISGKNGILSLATLKASKINDGEPVSNGSASDFSSLPSSSKISALVAAVMPEDPGNKTSVVVTYYIGSLESGEYTLAKVAAKKNSIPESLEDADVVMDIPAESGKYSVGSLEELTKYYFVIFVADSNGNNATSNPESIRTGEVPAPFRETVEVLKKTGDDEFTPVYEWTGKWGKPDDASITHFAVEEQEALNITESATETHFMVEHNETNFISEDTETEIVST